MAHYHKLDNTELGGKTSMSHTDSETSPRSSEETIRSAHDRSSFSPPRPPRGCLGLSISLVLTNIVTLALWLSSLHRIDTWARGEDYFDGPSERLGAAQVPVSYGTHKFSHIPLELGPGGTRAADSFWHTVLSVGLTRLAADQTAQYLGHDGTAREWNTTDSYVGVLGVFHQLHCLARVRYALLFPGRMEQFDGEATAHKHLGHCVEYLRQVIMCHGDVTVEPVGWNQTSLMYIAEPERLRVVRQCRNFDEIYEWAVDDAHQVPNAPGNEQSFREMVRFENDHARHGKPI